MMALSVEQVLALFLTMFVLSVVPGPSDFAVVAKSLAAGFASAASMVLGILAADVLFIVVALYGLAALAAGLGDLFIGVKWLAGCWLLWLGLSLWRTQSTPEPVVATKYAEHLGSFTAGFMITLADPKAILFYMGLFPAFLDLSELGHGDALTVIALATLVICGVKLTYAWLADRARRVFERASLRRVMDPIAGSVLILAALFILVRS